METKYVYTVSGTDILMIQMSDQSLSEFCLYNDKTWGQGEIITWNKEHPLLSLGVATMRYIPKDELDEEYDLNNIVLKSDNNLPKLNELSGNKFPNWSTDFETCYSLLKHFAEM